MVPALLPLIGLAPWTGWITFEEFDLLVLTLAIVGYGRWLLPWGSYNSYANAYGRFSAIIFWIALTLFAGSTLIAMDRGFTNAGGFTFGWFQGYHEPMNSVRLSKSLFLAILLLPLWQWSHRFAPGPSRRSITLGMTLGLAGASLAAVWERLAFTDLLNFSSNYRTTGLFWEMHVGGAALDGFFALTMPFAVQGLLQARTPFRWAAASMVAALGTYACLTTFSRGVYLAIPTGLALLFVLRALQIRRARGRSHVLPEANLTQWSHLTSSIPVVAFGVGAAWMFTTSGYRGIGALFGASAIVLPLVGVMRTGTTKVWISGFIVGMLMSVTLACFAWVISKGAYVGYVLALAVVAVMIVARQRGQISANVGSAMALAGFITTLTMVVAIAGYWGGSRAFWPAVAASSSCLALLGIACAVGRPLWSDSIRRQAGLASAMGVTLAVIAVFSGGEYMGSRLATGGSDMGGRLSHWKLGTDMLLTPADWWLGKGSGRFPANYFLVGDPQEHPGDYRLKHDGDNNYLRLAGGLHSNGWGEVFRVTQRIGVPGISPVLRARVRTAMDITLSFEVCEKHLLYNQGCLIKAVHLKAAPDQWQNIAHHLDGNSIERGQWFAPKLIAFSVGMATKGGEADLDQISLVRGDGHELLANGDFSEAMAHWFFSSDMHHLPWHIKNMFMHVMFDQGILGLTLWCMLFVGALVRLTVGKARDHPLGPCVVASLAGFATIGLFDSLLDVPRVATLFYLILLIGLTLTVRPQGNDPGRAGRAA